MTRNEALAEAQRRWGQQSKVYRWRKSPNGPMWSKVNALDGSGRFGIGATWEAAFADADRREGMSA